MITAMRIFRLVPTGRPDDGNWGRAFWQGEIVVRARSSGEARAVAARAEARAGGANANTTTQVTASALRDPTLYGVREDLSGRFTADGPMEVLGGRFRFPADYLVAHDD
jgi:hypothetical protein